MEMSLSFDEVFDGHTNYDSERNYKNNDRTECGQKPNQETHGTLFHIKAKHNPRQWQQTGHYHRNCGSNDLIQTQKFFN